MFEKLKDDLAETKAAKVELDSAMLSMLADLRYPVSQDGSVLDCTLFGPLIAWHLVRCGWRRDDSHRQIKPRKVVAKGVVRDAVEWVPVDAPDDPLANVENMTMAEIAKMSPSMKAEALRRLGGPELPALKRSGWHVETNMKIQDVPDSERQNLP